jgi:hypothetical protein
MARPLIPWVTLGLVALLLAVAAFSNGASLEYDARLASQPWRLVTSQLVHWSSSMLAGDVLLAGIAGAIVESRSRVLAVLAVAFGTAASGLAIAASHLERYRGSSGIGAALLVAGGLDLAVRGGTRPVRLAGVGALAFGTLKLVLEEAGATALLPDGIVPATAVHAAGAVAGAAAFVVVLLRRGRSIR